MAVGDSLGLFSDTKIEKNYRSVAVGDDDDDESLTMVPGRLIQPLLGLPLLLLL